MSTIPEMLDSHAAEHRARAAEEGRKATEARPLAEQAAHLMTESRRQVETLEDRLAEIEEALAEARTAHDRAATGHAEALAVVARHEAESQAHADVAEKVAALAEAARTAPVYDPDAALAATGLMPRDIPAEEHTCANMGCTSCTGCDGCTCHDPAHTCLPWDASTQTECDGCMNAAHAEVARADDLTAPGVADSRAQIAPHLPPPVPHEPPRIDTVHTSGTGAGQLVATSGPTVTMPDTGLNPDPLPPAPPTAEPRHAKDRPGLLARLTGGHRTIPDEQDGDDQ